MKQYGDEELSVIAEIARMYYVEGMSQIDIANMLFFSKAKVSRALRIAREENIVEFHINYPLKRSMKLETELKRKFGLQDARVVVDLYGNESTDISIKRIGEMAAGYLDETLKDGDIVGLSWGKTMYQTIKNITPSEPKKIQVVQVVGNSTDNYNLDIDVTSLVQKMAKIYQGTAHFSICTHVYQQRYCKKRTAKGKCHPTGNRNHPTFRLCGNGHCGCLHGTKKEYLGRLSDRRKNAGLGKKWCCRVSLRLFFG